MNEKLLSYLQKPELYAKSTAKFWDDEHISKGMLEAHLNPEFDAATRRHDFVDQSVEWITHIVPPDRYSKLLDLGSGPGLYTERFYKKGYQVTGIDFSGRSIEYAKKSAAAHDYNISYLYQDYLAISYQGEFDVITLIYRDFSVLSESDRRKLLINIDRALKPGGRFIVDVTMPMQYKNRAESTSWSYQEKGFWCEKPHICLDAFYRYDENNTFLNQAVIVTEDMIQSYYIWDHAFTQEELEKDLQEGGFRKVDFYGDVAGAEYDPEGVCMCAVAAK